MKWVICGGRRYQLTAFDYSLLDHLRPGISCVVCGCASGADTLAETWAIGKGINVIRFPANWNEHGRAAGMIRNSQMSWFADACLAFPGGRGTSDMVKKAKRRGLVVVEVLR